MNIAVVGGGTRCRKLIELIENYTFQEISPKVVAVADIRSDAPGFVLAKEKGISVTDDYNDFFHRDDLDLIMELTGNTDIFKDLLTRKKESVRIIGHNAAVLLWEIARVYALQVETKQQLEEATAKFDVLINEFIHENVMVIGKDYRILDVNEALLKDFGLNREEVIGRRCHEISRSRQSPCEGEDAVCPMSMVLKTRKPAQVTHTIYEGENHPRYFAISCYPLFENDQLVRAIYLSREITKDINMQKAMMQQEKLASIGRLCAGVAHEINNPLTTILTSSMLSQEEIDPGAPLYSELKTISDEAMRCRKIVTSLLDFARQTKPAKQVNDLNEIVNRSFVLTRKQAAFHDVTVALNLFEGLPHSFVDKDQIQQALINLTLNAIEATDPGGKIVLTTRFNAWTDTIEISVEDTGGGIPPEHLDKIFDPFSPPSKAEPGWGWP